MISILQKKDLYFRKLNENDIDELYSILNGLSEESKRYFHPHKFDKKTITKICKSKKDHYFVMQLKNKIIGYSFLRLFGYKIPSFGCVIRNEYQNKGYGSILTKMTVEKAKNLGYKKIILKVYKDNKKAYRVYKKIGFKKTKELKETNEFKMKISLS